MRSGGRGRRPKCGRSIFQIVIFQFQVVILSEAKDLAGCGKTSPQGESIASAAKAALKAGCLSQRFSECVRTGVLAIRCNEEFNNTVPEGRPNLAQRFSVCVRTDFR